MVKSADVVAELAGHASQSDLVVIGLQRHGRKRKAFGEMTLRLAGATDCPLIMISRRG